MPGPVTKRPEPLKKGGGVKTKSQGFAKPDPAAAEKSSRLDARAKSSAGGGANAKAPGGKDGFAPGTSVKDRIAAWEGKTGGDAKGAAAAPAAKKPFLKKGGGVKTPQNGGAPKKVDMSAHQADVAAAGKVAGSDLEARRAKREGREKPWQQGAKQGGGSSEAVAPKGDTPKDDVLDSDDTKKPSPSDIDKKLEEGKKDPSLWERVKEWVGGLFDKKDKPPAEVKQEEQEKKVTEDVTPAAEEKTPDPAPDVIPDPIIKNDGPDAPPAPADPSAKVVEDTGGGGDSDTGISSLDDAKGKVTGMLDDASGALGDKVTEAEGLVGDKVSEIEGKAGDAIKCAEDTVSGKVTEAEDMVGAKVGEIEGKAGDAIKGAEDAVSGKVSEAEDAVGAKVEETEGAIAKKWKESPARAMAAKLIGADNMDKVDGAIAGGYKDLKGKAKKQYDKMKRKAAKKYAELKDKAGDMYGGAKDAVAGKYQELKGKAGDMYQGAKDKAGDLLKGAKDSVKGAWDGAKGMVKKLKFW